MSLVIYKDTKLIVDKDIKLKWKDINDAFSITTEEDLEDRTVDVNIHKSSLYLIACRCPTFPCANIIHWIASHNNPKMMVLSSFGGTKIATFRA